jgi:hypothetical protein
MRDALNVKVAAKYSVTNLSRVRYAAEVGELLRHVSSAMGLVAGIAAGQGLSRVSSVKEPGCRGIKYVMIWRMVFGDENDDD